MTLPELEATKDKKKLLEILVKAHEDTLAEAQQRLSDFYVYSNPVRHQYSKYEEGLVKFEHGLSDYVQRIQTALDFYKAAIPLPFKAGDTIRPTTLVTIHSYYYEEYQVTDTCFIHFELMEATPDKIYQKNKFPYSLRTMNKLEGLKAGDSFITLSGRSGEEFEVKNRILSVE